MLLLGYLIFMELAGNRLLVGE